MNVLHLHICTHMHIWIYVVRFPVPDNQSLWQSVLLLFNSVAELTCILARLYIHTNVFMWNIVDDETYINTREGPGFPMVRWGMGGGGVVTTPGNTNACMW